MLMRLDELLGVDRAARWRIILVSGLGITIWGMVSELGKVPIHEAQVNATIFGVVIFIAQVLRYCLHSQTLTANFDRAALISRRLVTTAAASALLIFLVAI